MSKKMSHGGPCTFICSRTVPEVLARDLLLLQVFLDFTIRFLFLDIYGNALVQEKLRHILKTPGASLLMYCVDRAKLKFLRICWHNKLISPFSNIAIVIYLRALFQHGILPQISMLLDSGIVSFGIIMRVDMIGMYLRSCKTR